MDRAAFLIESTNERIRCLLNPDSVLIRRVAGIKPARSASGQLTGVGLSDDPLHFTGGGRTEVQLDLLFDVEIAGSSITTTDVRDLTAPLWNLTEGATDYGATTDGAGTRYSGPPIVRFVWGKSWNIPGVVASVAERLEQFTAQGVPQRSWLRMLLLRVNEPQGQQATRGIVVPGEIRDAAQAVAAADDGGADLERTRTHEVLGGTGEDGEAQGERLDEIASRYYGDSSLWRLIASFNNIDNPGRLIAGTILRIPPLPGTGAAQ